MQTSATSTTSANANAHAGGPLAAARRFVTRRSLHGLTADERDMLVDAQVSATRPIVSGVLISGAVILAMTGLFEAVGIAPGIGYPWWLVELAAAAIAGCGMAAWHIADWRPRLVLTLLGTLLLGVFMSLPVPDVGGQLAIRTGLFQLLPIALLALLVRPASIACMVALMFGLAYARIAMHGPPPSGAALYWLYTFTTIGFGLLMGGYRTDYAVSSLRLRRRLWQQAHTDALTSLLNRSGWNREAGNAYAEAITRGQSVSFVFFDIDFFKAVNDTHGHDVGDRVLQILGRILDQRTDDDSYCARLGGEEFVVMVVDQPAEQVESFVKRVRSEFEREASEYATRVSAGIAHRQQGEAMPAQLKRADMALYEAKATGRDRFVVSRT